MNRVVPADELLPAALQLAARHRARPAGRLPLHEAERRRRRRRGLRSSCSTAKRSRRCWTGSTADHREGVGGVHGKARAAVSRRVRRCVEREGPRHAAHPPDRLRRARPRHGLAAARRAARRSTRRTAIPGVAEFGIDNAVYRVRRPVHRADLADPGRHGGGPPPRPARGGRLHAHSADRRLRSRPRAHRARSACARCGRRSYPTSARCTCIPRTSAARSSRSTSPSRRRRGAGAGPWRRQHGRRGDQRVVAVTVEATRPREMAQRWAQVLGPRCGAGRRRGAHRG